MLRDSILRMYGGGKSGRLPAGYTQIDYIIDNGDSYILTDINQYSNMWRYEFDVKMTDWTTVQKPHFIFGINVSEPKAQFGAWYRKETSISNNTGVWFQSGANCRTHDAQITTERTLIKMTNGLLEIEDRYLPFNESPELVQNGLVILGANGDVRCFIGECYGVKIYDGNTKKFDGVPARRDADNTKGLYDFVGKKFYPSSSNTPFM